MGSLRQSPNPSSLMLLVWLFPSLDLWNTANIPPYLKGSKNGERTQSTLKEFCCGVEQRNVTGQWLKGGFLPSLTMCDMERGACWWDRPV